MAEAEPSDEIDYDACNLPPVRRAPARERDEPLGRLGLRDEAALACPFCPDPLNLEPAVDDPRVWVVAEHGAWRRWRDGDLHDDRRLAHDECERIYQAKRARHLTKMGAGP